MRAPNALPSRRLTVAALAATAVLASGCSSLNQMLGGDTVDYRSGARQTAGLEVPPDLTQLARDGRFQAPTAVVSAAAQGSSTAPAAAPVQTVAANAMAGMSIERSGDARWLRVPAPPEQLWPQLRQFWLDAGFTLEIDNAQIGVIETAWAENRAKLPQDFLRRTLGQVFENLYDSGERDRFRMRVERTAEGSEIYITHRGLVEMATDRALQDEFRWRARPADPQLEAEFLTRLMVHLGRDEAAARTQVAAAPAAGLPAARARLVEGQATATLEVDAGFDLAWRRVGVALDRSGFTVEDRDRSAGLYYVRYADPDAKAAERGFLARLLSSDDAAPAQRYRIALQGDREKTVVAVLTAEGSPVAEGTGQRIAGVLVDALK